MPALARFLRVTPSISKKGLGQYLGHQQNIDVLKEVMLTFEFRGKRIDEALRLMLESFRLPGESQQIERVMETFASVYFSTKPKYLATQDAAFVMSYSIIMLNTDQHNPQVKNRMKVEDFIRNNRGINNGVDLDHDFLREIYKSIKE